MALPEPTPAAVRSLRERLWDAGYRPIPVYNIDQPVTSPGKHPKGDDWTIRARLTPPAAVSFNATPDALNTGLLCDGLQGVDLDVDDVDLCHKIKAFAFDLLGIAPMRWRNNSPRILLLYRAAEGQPPTRRFTGTKGKIEILGYGAQFISHGLHPTGAVLQWSPEPPESVPVAQLPAVSDAQMDAFLLVALPLVGADFKKAGNGQHQSSTAGLTANLLKVAGWLSAIPNEGPANWADWNHVGMATWAASEGSRGGFDAWCAWSQAHPSFDPAAAAERWENYRRSPPTFVGAGTLAHLAREALAKKAAPAPAAPSATIHYLPAPEGSEDALALDFASTHKDRLRYVAAWGRWMKWTGSIWEEDSTLHVYDMVRELCRIAAQNSKVAKKLTEAKTIAAVERMARSDRRLAAHIDQWDANLWILNTPSGVVDLRTGQLRKADPDDYCTKSTLAAPSGEAPLFLAFLRRVCAGNPDLISYLQRFCGYCLTGVTTEHVLAFLHGTGGNGKSVFIHVVSSILGDYGITAPIEMFMASKSDQHPTALAGLRGARLVTAIETEEGRRWAETRIKAITGGDRISARFMRQDFFEFQPQFKLMIAGNHKPGLRGVDEAIRRRLNLVPFTVTIPEAERDKELESRLQGEYGGILAWMVEGCVDWQERGLRPPSVIIAATEKYLEAEDSFTLWLEECTLYQHDAWSSSRELFDSWQAWAKRAGELPGNQKRFAQGLEAKGYPPARNQDNTKRGFLRIRIKQLDPQDEIKY